MQQLLELVSGWPQWVYSVALLVAVLVAGSACHGAISAIGQRTKPELNVWREALLNTLGAPVHVLFWIAAVALVEQRFIPEDQYLVLSDNLPSVLDVLVILATAWFLMRFIKRVQANYIISARHRGNELDPTAMDAIGKLAWVLVCIITVLAIMQVLGVSIGGLLAFGGAAGIAVGFAAQTLVSNLFGGLTVYASRIFRVGEDIIIPGTELAGTVQHIGWRSTRVLGWNGKPAYIPNSVFNSSNLVNNSRLTHRTISEHFLLRYEQIDKVREIVKQVNTLLEKRDDLSYFVFRFDNFGDKALKLYLYAWAQTVPHGGFVPYAEFMRIKEEILLDVVDIAHQQGCELILPLAHVQLHGRGDIPAAFQE